MATTVASPRDLFVLLLGELLYVERRLAGGVLRDLATSTADEELAAVLRQHLDETKRHVDRAEAVFRRIDVTPSAHRVAAFECALDRHDQLASSIVCLRSRRHLPRPGGAAYRALGDRRNHDGDPTGRVERARRACRRAARIARGGVRRGADARAGNRTTLTRRAAAGACALDAHESGGRRRRSPGRRRW